MEDAAQSPLRPPNRPNLSRSHSDLSVAAAANEPIHPDRQPTVLMNKRHSFVTASHIPFEWKDSGSPPNRPPRNPARTMTQNFDNASNNVVANNTMAGPSKPRKTTRPSTASGTREAVTPWELYPVPDWDQQPPVRPSTRPSTSSSQNSAFHFVESAFVKRNKSNGKSQSKPKVNGSPVSETRPKSHAEPISDNPMAMAFGGGDLGIYSPMYYKPRKSTKSPKAAQPVATPAAPPVVAQPAKVQPPKPAPPPIVTQPIKVQPPKPPPPPIPPPSDPIPPPAPIQAQAAPILPPPPSQPVEKKPSRPSIDKQSDQNVNRNKFSTADRTILEELKRNITARAAQFVYKGGSSAGWGAQGVGAGKKHHPYPKEEVPYPRCYDRVALDLDVWETMFSQQICDSLTWHVFSTPPLKVLDIGCGTGTWLLNCARAWKDSSFVGLDVVPLHPDLMQVGNVDLASRITWVQANFLEGLPFPNEEFDFVHVKRIALGVPEDKWDGLFEEITRVMKPGAAFELVEEDLFFPGQLADDDDDGFDHGHTDSSRPQSEQDHDTDSGSAGSRRNSVSPGRHSDETISSQGTGSTGNTSPRPPDGVPHANGYFSPKSQKSSKGSRETVDPELNRNDNTFSSSDHAQNKAHNRSATVFQLPRAPTTKLQKSPSVVNIRDRRQATKESEVTPPLPTLRIQPQLPAYGTSGFHLPTGGSRSQAHSNPQNDWLSKTLSMAPTSAADSHGVGRPVTNNRHSTAFGPNDFIPPTTTPFIHRSLPKAPSNPRDHALLEYIYVEMCGARFINLAPLSLLGNLVVLHFKDVRTHPPLQLTFPPLPLIKPREYSPEESDTDEEARDAIVPSPTRGRSRQKTPDDTPKPNQNPPTGYFDDQDPDQKRFLSIRGLIQGSSPYVSLDDTRISAFSPSSKLTFTIPRHPAHPNGLADGETVKTPTGEGLPPSQNPGGMAIARAAALSARKNRLPNTTIRLDLRTLNLHLALRVAEVMGCSESMWEWVQDVQRERREERAAKAQRARSGSGSINVLANGRNRGMSVSSATSSFRKQIYEMSREEFDGLLFNFEMDMHDQMTLGSALRERFPWFSTRLRNQTSRRKLFETACEQWSQWDQDHPSASSRPSMSSTLSKEPVSTSNETPHPRANAGSLSDVEKAKVSSPTSSNSTVAPPTRKLSRSFRVFVAWKHS